VAIKAGEVRIVKVFYKDTNYFFIVKHFGGREMAALKARHAEMEALEAAAKTPENAAEIEALSKRADLNALIADQAAANIIDVTMEAKPEVVGVEIGADGESRVVYAPGPSRIVPAEFENDEGESKPWKQMTYEERAAEVAKEGALFGAVWADIAYATRGARILGK